MQPQPLLLKITSALLLTFTAHMAFSAAAGRIRGEG